MYSNSYVNKELKKIMNDYDTDFKAKAFTSRQDYVLSLPVGAQIPDDKTRIYTEQGRDEFRQTCNEYRAKVDSVIDSVIDDLRAKLSEPPTAEAVNTVSMFQLRSAGDVTEDEVYSLLRRYQDNPQTYRSIVSIAREKGLKIYADNPIEIKANEVETIANSIKMNFDPMREFREGYSAFLGAQIDSVFPVD